MGYYKLKKSYIQETINLYGVRFLLSLFKRKFKNQVKQEKILVKASDGIGDLLIRSKLSEKIIEKYGKENVYFLMKDSYVGVGEILGYNSIRYSRKERKNFFQRLKKMYYLNMQGFSKYINLEFVNDITVGNLFIEERIGINDYNKAVYRNNKYYTKSFDRAQEKYVLYIVQKMWGKIIEEKISLEEIKPDLRYLFELKEEGIVIQVGSSDREKVCSPLVMAEYIKKIKEINPKEKITLVGNGKLQDKYAKKLEELLPNLELNNLVNKTTLKSVFEEVAKAKIYFGFDSGLYNLAFSLKKPILAIFNSKDQKGFYHQEKNVKILFATETEIKESIINDYVYTNKAMNSVKKDRIIRSYKELLNGAV